MVTIFNERAIKIAWTIYKGVSAVKENFDRANVVVFLIDHRGNKINVGCRQEMGTLYVDIPAGALHEGIYSIEAIWAKNRDFTRPHSWEMAPWVLNHTFMDSRNIVRCLKEDLFAVTEYIREQAGVFPDEGTVVVKAKSSAATYGYDGLDAYEMSVVLGYTTLSRDEWLAQLNDPQTWFMRYLKELIRLNNLIAPGALTFDVVKAEGKWTYTEGDDTATEGLPYHLQVLADEHYVFDTEGLQLTMFGYPITEETEGVTIVWSNENTLLDITIAQVTGTITVEPSVIAESGTIELKSDIDQPSNPRWSWVDEDNLPVGTIEGSYDSEVKVYLQINDAVHYELPSEGIYYDDAGEGSCAISYEPVDGVANKYEVAFTEVTGDVTILVNLLPLTISVNSNGLHGFDVKVLVDGNEVSTIYKGEDVTIQVKPTDAYAAIIDAPKYKLGASGEQTSFGEVGLDGWYSVELQEVEQTIYLIGTAELENRTVWGTYEQESFVDAAILADLTSSILDNGTPVNGSVITQDITTNSFFVGYPAGHFPEMKETSFDTPYELSDGLSKSNIIWHNNPNYVIWVFKNSSYDTIGGKVEIVTT